MRHLDPELLLMVLAGEVPPRALLQVMYDHLKELCPECRSNLETVARELDWALDGDGASCEPANGADGCTVEPADARAGARPAASPYEGAFRRAEAAARSKGDRLLEERAEAQRELEELRTLAPSERSARLAEAPSRFRSRWLAQLLVDSCVDAVRRDPDDALSLAELVPAVLERIPGALAESWGEELHARSLAHRGNALRVRGDMTGADAAFFELHRFLVARSLEIDDLHPELPALEAALRSNQCRFGEALELLDRALVRSREIGDQRLVAINLTNRGTVRSLNGDLEGARSDQELALGLIDPATDPHLYLCTVCNHCLYLCDAGEHAEAEAVLEHHDDRIRHHADPWLDVRVEEIRGRIDRALGRPGDAETRFLAVRERYAEQDLPYDAALTSLHLAELYLEQGRHRELADTARWMTAVFDTAGVDSEAMVAVALLQRAVASEQVSRKTLAHLRHRLEQIGARPDRRVQQPS